MHVFAGTTDLGTGNNLCCQLIDGQYPKYAEVMPLDYKHWLYRVVLAGLTIPLALRVLGII